MRIELSKIKLLTLFLQNQAVLQSLKKKQSREAEELVKQRRREKFFENQLNKIYNEIADMERRSNILQNHGGLCKFVKDDDLVKRSKSILKPLPEILKSEIKYQKLLGRKMKFGTVPLKLF